MGDAYHLDCSFCDVQIEISKKAYATRCNDPEAVLESVRAKLAWSKRPRIDVNHMKSGEAVPAASASAGEETPLMAKQQTVPDALTSAAQAIGSTLGKLAVKTGIAKLPAVAKKAAKKPAKKAASKKAAPAVKKTAPKKATKKTARAR